MSKFISKASQTKTSAAFKSLVRNVFRVDPAATRHLEDTFVKVHLNSRIWMV